MTPHSVDPRNFNFSPRFLSCEGHRECIRTTSKSRAGDSSRWRINRTALIGRPRRRRRRSTKQVRSQFVFAPKRADQRGKNPKAFGFANPGRLAKQAVRSHDVWGLPLLSFQQTLTIVLDQRKAPPCPSCRPPPRRSSPNHCRCGWTSWSGQNYSHQILD